MPGRRWMTAALFAALAQAVIGITLVESALRVPRRRFGSTVDRSHAPAEIRATDGVLLRGWLYPASRSPGGRAVIILHGVGDNRLGVAAFAAMFTRRGFDVLTPDSRGHGESGGLVTYGVREAGDVARWAGWLREGGARRLYGLGESMGAAILLQSLAAGAPFQAVAAESPFSSFREIAYDRMGQPFGLGHWFGRYPMRPVVEAALLYARHGHRLDFSRVSPLEAVRATRVPVLLIHGEADRNIPVRHSRLIAGQRLAHVVLWEVPEASHTRAYAARPVEFERRLLEFFASSDPRAN